MRKTRGKRSEMWALVYWMKSLVGKSQEKKKLQISLQLLDLCSFGVFVFTVGYLSFKSVSFMCQSKWFVVIQWCKNEHSAFLSSFFMLVWDLFKNISKISKNLCNLSFDGLSHGIQLIYSKLSTITFSKSFYFAIAICDNQKKIIQAKMCHNQFERNFHWKCCRNWIDWV